MKVRFNIPRKRKTNVWRERRNAKCGIKQPKTEAFHAEEWLTVTG